MPEPSLRQIMDKRMFWRFLVYAQGEIYAVFDDESDFQIESNKIQATGPNIWKNLILTNLMF